MRILALGAFALLAVACSSAVPSGAENEVVAAVEGEETAVSYTAFSKTVTDRAGEGAGCTIAVTGQKGGLQVTVSTGEESYVTVTVPSTSAISRVTRAEDNATTDRYVVEGSGEVRILQVEGSYYEVTVMDATQATATCEIEI